MDKASLIPFPDYLNKLGVQSKQVVPDQLTDLKVTLPRLKILEILEGGGARHKSAEDIYKALLSSNEDIGLATVYRVLTQFEAAGLVLKHNFEGGHAVYELDRGQHHDRGHDGKVL